MAAQTLAVMCVCFQKLPSRAERGAMGKSDVFVADEAPA